MPRDSVEVSVWGRSDPAAQRGAGHPHGELCLGRTLNERRCAPGGRTAACGGNQADYGSKLDLPTSLCCRPASGLWGWTPSVGVFFFMEDILFRTLFISFAFVFFGGLLFLLDFLHNRYNDNLLEEITLLIEALVEQQERTVFSEAEDTLTARLQHQLLKLRNILKAQNQMLTQEKEQIKTLISDISHQIKTPVAAANTFAQLLGDTGLSDEERREYIATLQMSLEKLTFLTNSLIKMSRLESGIIRLKPEQSSLNDIVMQAVKTVYAKARDKNITITFDCGQTFEALLDFNWTAEAVTNVLDNAVKYTPSGGVVDLKITEYPSYLRLDVSDNGIGIPEEEQAKIFGRFYRGKQSAGVDGVGIGLYLTRDIVNKQNGYIKVASDEKGTIFSLFL